MPATEVGWIVVGLFIVLSWFALADAGRLDSAAQPLNEQRVVSDLFCWRLRRLLLAVEEVSDCGPGDCRGVSRSLFLFGC